MACAEAEAAQVPLDTRPPARAQPALCELPGLQEAPRPGPEGATPPLYPGALLPHGYPEDKPAPSPGTSGIQGPTRRPRGTNGPAQGLAPHCQAGAGGGGRSTGPRGRLCQARPLGARGRGGGGRGEAPDTQTSHLRATTPFQTTPRVWAGSHLPTVSTKGQGAGKGSRTSCLGSSGPHSPAAQKAQPWVCPGQGQVRKPGGPSFRPQAGLPGRRVPGHMQSSTLGVPHGAHTAPNTGHAMPKGLLAPPAGAGAGRGGEIPRG